MLKPLALTAALSLAAATAAHAGPTGWGAAPAGAKDQGSGHLFTVSVPYQFDKLQSTVSAVDIVCSIKIRLIDPNTQRPGRLEILRKSEHLAPQAGHVAGTAVLTWERSDFDPLADLQHPEDVECWFELDIQGKGMVSYQPNIGGVYGGGGANSAGTMSPEPAAHHDHNAPFRPFLTGQLK